MPLNHVALTVADRARSAAFYGEHFGLTERILDDEHLLILGAADGSELALSDAEAVPTERLGVRVSIIERVANAGGIARVVSSPGQGTVVTLRWPAPRSHVIASAPADADVAGAKS